jgi:hypothetical protein
MKFPLWIWVEDSRRGLNNKGETQVMAMIQLICSKKSHRWFIQLAPAILILIFTIFLSIFLGEFTFLKGSKAIYKGLLRFLRIALPLCFPLYLLLPIFWTLGRLVQSKNEGFLQVEGKQDLEIHPVKHWLLRPLQGLGIGLLFGTKLLSVLQVVTGTTASVSLFIPKGQFQFGRFMVVTGITVLISLLLSTIWTLDDMGIRYFNRKNHEIKMIGKYAGTLMPILFGFYGVISLFGQFQMTQALIYLFQVAIILYPPFAIFSVFHIHFIQKKGENLVTRLFDEKGDLNHRSSILGKDS